VPLAAAFLLLASQTFAGPAVRAGDQPAPQLRHAATPVVRAVALPVTISVVASPRAQTVAQSDSVSVRGPDGQVRRFAVEGGRDAIVVRQVYLRPGTSVTFQWSAGK
jgi:hypothetical protein